MKQLEKYSMGIGDRFGQQGKTQLQAFIRARAEGIALVPVWNKSFREHSIISTCPDDVRTEADRAAKDCNWQGGYYVDADHIHLDNVDAFIAGSDFFTLDVADYIGKPADPSAVDAFVKQHSNLIGTLELPVCGDTMEITQDSIRAIAERYLFSVQQAGAIYRHLIEKKGEGNFITEISMDETDHPQTPVEIFLVLAAVAAEGIPAQTIAPKFVGDFFKGIDYVGDPAQFETEFEQITAGIQFAVKKFGLPANLKISVHSGSDKFSIYPAINRICKKYNTGLHLKTAGTTWLEELIGLAEAGEQGLQIAKEIYSKSLTKIEELVGPYCTVLDLDESKLPAAAEVQGWTGKRYADCLRHDQNCSDYNLHFRQLLHVGYKIAAQMGPRYLDALDDCEDSVAKNVTENILVRHIRSVFG